MRYVIFVLATFFSALGLLWWLGEAVVWACGGPRPHDASKWRKVHRGLLEHPRLVDAWERLGDNPFSAHEWKNVTSESVRLDAEVSSKVLSGALWCAIASHLFM